jgi:uncharacterized protein YlxW (UPF0749 family)
MTFGPDYAMQAIKDESDTFRKRCEFLREEVELLAKKLSLREEQITSLQFENQKLKSKIASVPIEGVAK